MGIRKYMSILIARQKKRMQNRNTSASYFPGGEKRTQGNRAARNARMAYFAIAADRALARGAIFP